MRILYVSESIKWSGGAQQLVWMAEALRQKGHDLRLACQVGSDMIAPAERAGIPIDFIRIRQDYDVPSAITLSALVKRHRAEVLHAQHSTAHAVGLMAAYFSKVPAFAVTRRVVFPIRRNLFSRLKYLSSRINGYVAISEAVKVELLKAGLKPRQIQVIPSVINIKAATVGDGVAFRQELSIPLDVPVISHVANLADFKGQDILLKAIPDVLREFPNAVFVLAGRDTEKLQPQVDQQGLQASVRLPGFRKDVPRVLAAGTLFVLPSRQEAAGTAVREAMALGLPCIASNVGGLGESIEDGVTGLLIPVADAQALSAAIRRYLKNPSEADRLARAGQDFVVKNFSLDSAATQMEGFYERILTR